MRKLYNDYYTVNINICNEKLDKQQQSGGLYIDDGIRIGTYIGIENGIYFKDNLVVLSGGGWYLCSIRNTGHSFYSVLNFGSSVSFLELPVEVREYVMVAGIK